MLPEPIPYFPQSYFKANRDALLALLPDESMVILGGKTETIRNQDTSYPFRQDSDFEHLTGFLEPDALLVLCKNKTDTTYILFVNERDPVMETWNGRRLGPCGVREQLNVDLSFTLAEIAEQLPKLLSGAKHVYSSIFQTSPNIVNASRLIKNALKHIHSLARSGIYPPVNFHDINPLLHQLRLIKTPLEIQMLKIACDISVKAHIAAMQMTRANVMEYQVASTIHHVFENHGGTWGYGTIVGGGDNGCILHYTQNNQALNTGDLVLIDAGCELHGFTGDITHTYPVSGTMNAAQLAVYEIVLSALNKATQALKVGAAYSDFHNIAVRELTLGLKDLKLLSGDLETLIETNAYKRFYMHRTGHYLGRDVHDVGRYCSAQDTDILLEDNMVITVEPGLYIPSDADIPKEFRGLGIRLEDDVVVMGKTPLNLTAALPRDPNLLKDIIGIY
ncbi:proline aminopeptidase P II [Gammaproteobacteria bacterium]|nr:proline aminopeptidase P II [Gammaproteobacteria bacterium]